VGNLGRSFFSLQRPSVTLRAGSSPSPPTWSPSMSLSLSLSLSLCVCVCVSLGVSLCTASIPYQDTFRFSRGHRPPVCLREQVLAWETT
jgi:hypothetical protein